MSIEVHVEAFRYANLGRAVLRDLRLTVESGSTAAVLGVSGCGKSTLLRLIAGLSPSGGAETLAGSISIFGQTPAVYRSTGQLSFMFQDATLLPNRTVRENIALPLEILHRNSSARVDEMLELVGLSEFRDYLPKQLSGGMKTRVSLARSFVTEPRVLLLDEPFAALDIAWKRDLYESLGNLSQRFGTTGVIVTHDLEEAFFNANKIMVLDRLGTPAAMVETGEDYPRPYPFTATVSRFTAQLEAVANVMTQGSDPTVHQQAPPTRR